MSLKTARRVPCSTYRLQLNRNFTFADVERLVPYLTELGISDIYCSPILLSAPGSSHGYDVNDYRKIDPELGGEEGFNTLVRELRAREMGVLLDFVPNHMGIQGEFNEWWLDVLESGPLSPYANFFDIRWNAIHQADTPRVLVPILDEHYGRVLEKGRLSLVYRGQTLAVEYEEFHFPLNAASYVEILDAVCREGACSNKLTDSFTQIARGFERLPSLVATDTAAGKRRAAALVALKRQLSQLIETDADARATLEAQLKRLNGDPADPASLGALDRILEQQHYRLARWKAGVHEINYRRFFAVDSLAGLRMENPEVFRQSHVLIARLLAGGQITGLRIDHIDGLWDPEEYLERLQTLAGAAGANASEASLYVLVEKILGEGEKLPESWSVHGTTGYEFIRHLAAALVDSTAQTPLTQCYRQFTGETEDFETAVYTKKRLILEDMFANALIHLGHSLAEIVHEDRRWRDLTRHELTTAVREFMAQLPVYRTYRRTGGNISAQDRTTIQQTYERALAANPRIDPEPFRFLRELLAGDYPATNAPAEYRNQLERWILTLQQYTGAVMAKSVEDTTFYTYCRFIALNEVGGDPAQIGAPVDAFHAANKVRLAQVPHCLLATSTHDTKVSEDVRARLYALSEIPSEWREWVQEWHGLNQGLLTRLPHGDAPDRLDEYRLYQVLIGAWPLDESGFEPAFRERIREHMRKAMNEAKRNTSWINPNQSYLDACDRFIDHILTPDSSFLRSFLPKAYRLARFGMVNSLAQLVLKCTVPGVPDFYQGNELWDFSLVDPDNRRSVDFARRQQLLKTLDWRNPAELLRTWRDGRIKLLTTQALLMLRRRSAALFQVGTYVPHEATGSLAHHVLAFTREHEGQEVAVVVPRLTARLGTPPVGAVWDDTRLPLGTAGTWRNVITGKEHGTGEIPLAEMFADLPFAVLERA